MVWKKWISFQSWLCWAPMLNFRGVIHLNKIELTKKPTSWKIFFVPQLLVKLVYETVHVLKPANLGKVLYIIEPRYAWILQAKGFEFPTPQNLKRYTLLASCMYISYNHTYIYIISKYSVENTSPHGPFFQAILEHFLKWCVCAAYFLQKKICIDF